MQFIDFEVVQAMGETGGSVLSEGMNGELATPCFVDTTREERFFCSVLMHVLLGPTQSRERILDLISTRTGRRRLPSEGLEVYTEVAALRDAWAKLGDQKEYADSTHQKRLQMLHRILVAHAGLSLGEDGLSRTVEQAHDVFFTTKGKLVSPGRWPLSGLTSIPGLDPSKLRSLKWAFNAKPDLMLISGDQGILVEAKVVSGVGSNSQTHYDQLEVQRVVAHLIPVVTDGLVAGPLDLMTLSNKAVDSRHNIHWSEIASLLDQTEIDAFSFRALARAAIITT